MRKKDIDKLLSFNKEEFNKILNLQKESIKDKNILSLYEVIIKNILENFRSILDYSIHDIYEYIFNKSREKIYFPYSKEKNKFVEKINKNLPNLKELNYSIYSLLLSIQPFTCNDDWLYNLCNITNSFKHNNLLKQNREDIKLPETKIDNFFKLPGKSTIILENCKIIKNGKEVKTSKYIELSNNKSINEIKSQFNNELDIKRTYFDWVNFKITHGNLNINIIEFINKCFDNIKFFIIDLYKLMK